MPNSAQAVQTTVHRERRPVLENAKIAAAAQNNPGISRSAGVK
jgi:hypothetical protein